MGQVEGCTALLGTCSGEVGDMWSSFCSLRSVLTDSSLPFCSVYPIFPPSSLSLLLVSLTMTRGTVPVVHNDASK